MTNKGNVEAAERRGHWEGKACFCLKRKLTWVYASALQIILAALVAHS